MKKLTAMFILHQSHKIGVSLSMCVCVCLTAVAQPIMVQGGLILVGGV